MTDAPTPIVRDLAPDRGWGSFARNASHDAVATRASLGLPTDRPIVMTGHHAEWWHPGLIVKYIAAQHLARAHDAAWSWLLVDHKECDPFRLDVPVLDELGVLTRATVRMSDAPDAGVVSSSLASAHPEQRPVSGSMPETIRNGLEHVIRAMETHADAPTALDQWMLGMRDTLAPEIALPDPIYATRLLNAPAVRTLIERMRDEPFACALAYNRAAETVPEAGLAPLHVGVDPGAVELPLWWITDQSTLGRVFAGDLDAIAPDRLAPRALLLTGLARWLLCDLFIHGAGGSVYDRATEHWFARWLGVGLAPMGAITADVRLPLDVPEVTAKDVRAAAQFVHRARHQPALLGDNDAQRAKFERVRAIRDMPPGSSERRTEFIRMHTELDQVRAGHAEDLASLESQRRTLESRHRSRAVALARDWAFALHNHDARRALIAETLRTLDA